MLSAIDFLKAALTAILLMALNVALSFAVMAAYAYVIDPGHDGAYYEAAAQEIAPWSSVVCGVPLFFGAAFLAGRRKPQRSAIGFAVATFAVYAAIDFTIIVAAGAFGKVGLIFAISMATKLAAAIAGAAFVGKKDARL